MVAAAALLFVAVVALAQTNAPKTSPPIVSPGAREQVSGLEKRQLSFVPNRGQAHSGARYLAQSGGATF